MKTFLKIFFSLAYVFSYCNNEDSTFIDNCYFSEDGNWAFVSELNFVSPWNNTDRYPVYGLYKLGNNETKTRIFMTKDSLYFFDNEVYPITIDSIFDKKTFFEKFQLYKEGINVTEKIKIEIDEKFLKEINTLELWNLEETEEVSFTAANTKYFDYFIHFYYNLSEIFTDTISNSYANKQKLMEGLNEIEKSEIYTEDDNMLIGTIGYGTRVYVNSDKTLYFIRAKYDLSSYVDLITTYHQAKNNTVGMSISNMGDKPKELRILLKLSN